MFQETEKITLPIGNNAAKYLFPHIEDIYVDHHPFMDDVESHPAALKKIEIWYVNKVFKGYGFLNENGGVELYSKIVKEKNRKEKISFLEHLQDRLLESENKIKEIEPVVLKNSKKAQEWEELINSLNKGILICEGDIRNISSLSQRGLITEIERNVRREFVLNEQKREKKKLKEIKTKFDKYKNEKSSLLYLSAIVPEIKAEISELHNSLNMDSFLTINKAGITIVKAKEGKVSNLCCLFCNILDYHAFDYLRKKKMMEDIPGSCDYIIMNDPRNFIDMMECSERYKSVYCFFPNTNMGRVIEKTVINTNNPRYKNKMPLYKDYVSLYEMACKLDK